MRSKNLILKHLMLLKTHRQFNRDHHANFTPVLVSDWPTTLTPLDTVCSQTDEQKTLITKYEMAIICPKQVTTAIKHDTGCIVRIATEIEQTSEHHWYGVFMRYAPSANGILHLTLHPMIVVLLCSILLVLLVICFYIYVYLPVLEKWTTSCYLIWA